MQLCRTKFRKSYIFSAKNWMKCFPGKNPVKSRVKSGYFTDTYCGCESIFSAGVFVVCPAAWTVNQIGVGQRQVHHIFTARLWERVQPVEFLSYKIRITWSLSEGVRRPSTKSTNLQDINRSAALSREQVNLHAGEGRIRTVGVIRSCRQNLEYYCF